MNRGQVAMKTVEFGYKCQECGQGTVVGELVPEYRTKIKGYPWTVRNARIGICDRCGAEHFDPNETLRWRNEFEEKQSYLTPAEIRELRQRLGLSMEQFAILIGCTRQSLYNWERGDRPSPQSRMADIFMRLVRESHSRGQIDILNFLTLQAASVGFNLSVSSGPKPLAPILTFARKVPLNHMSSSVRQPMPLAADTESRKEAVVLMTEDGQSIARLSYDYKRAALNVAFLLAVPFAQFDAEIRFKDGQASTTERAALKDQQATLLSKTKYTEDDVDQVRLLPQGLASTPENK
jgi:putative zinc finger/helix-turn-helix YgiT family protein